LKVSKEPSKRLLYQRTFPIQREVFLVLYQHMPLCLGLPYRVLPNTQCGMSEAMDVSLIDPVTVNILLLVWFAYLGYRLRRDRAPMARSIVLKLLGSIILELGLSVSSHFLPVFWWMQILQIMCLHCSLLLVYLASDQLLNNKPYLLLTKHWLFPLMLISISIGATLDALSNYHLEAFLVDPAFQPAPLYIASYLWNYGLQLCLVVFTLSLYWQSLDRHTALTYLIRRLICTLSFFIAACSLLAIVINLFLFLLGEKVFRLPLSQIVPLGETLVVWLLVASFTIPQDAMERAVQPVESSLAWRQWLQHDLLYSLHEKMIQVVPCVHLAYDEMQDVRVLIEISDARQIMWSHIPLTHPITVKEEARYLLYLLRQNIVITAPSTYQPLPTRQRNVIKHNLAVAKRLKHYERQGHIHSASPPFDTLPSTPQPVLREVRSRNHNSLQNRFLYGILQDEMTNGKL